MKTLGICPINKCAKFQTDTDLMKFEAYSLSQSLKAHTNSQTLSDSNSTEVELCTYRKERVNSLRLPRGIYFPSFLDIFRSTFG